MELVGPAAAQCKTLNAIYSAIVTVTNILIAPKDPQYTLHILYGRSKNSSASYFDVVLVFLSQDVARKRAII